MDGVLAIACHVDMERVAMPENPIGLLKMWGDVKEEDKR